MSTQEESGAGSVEPPAEVSRDAPYLAGVTPTGDDGPGIGPIAEAAGGEPVVPLEDVPELADPDGGPAGSAGRGRL